MNLTCPHCSGEVWIDVNRVVPGRTRQAACPRCRQTFLLPPEVVGEAPPPPAPVPPEVEAWLMRQLAALKTELKAEIIRELPQPASGGEALRMVGRPMSKLDGREAPALVAVTDAAQADMVCASLGVLGTACEVAADVRAAAQGLADRDRSIVVIDEALTGDEKGGARVLAAIDRLPGARRRRMFVAYIGDSLVTLDGGMAFTCGANVTINRADLPALTDILQRALRAHEKLYGAFLEIHEVGSSRVDLQACKLEYSIVSPK